jgi:hypothetical protein
MTFFAYTCFTTGPEYFSLDSLNFFEAMLWIRIHRFRMFLDLLDSDPLVRGTDSAPALSSSKNS